MGCRWPRELPRDVRSLSFPERCVFESIDAFLATYTGRAVVVHRGIVARPASFMNAGFRQSRDAMPTTAHATFKARRIIDQM
eukprot:9466901-Lingulodinium_polyedra.AAC.1